MKRADEDRLGTQSSAAVRARGRDPSGARVGAILQGLIAREPIEERPPVIRGRLPGGFVPPQVAILSAQPSTDVVLVRPLVSGATHPRLTADDVLWWHGDVN